MSNAKDLLALCRSRNATLSSCESLTAGLFTATMASVPGASSILKGGLVTYFTEMKVVLAKVDPTLIETYGVISKECSVAMAQNTRKLTDSTYCVSFTGNAGPEAMEDKPAGRVYCTIASVDRYETYCFQVDSLDRNALREYIVEKMIENCIEFIEKE